jgi:hypothetical protein
MIHQKGINNKWTYDLMDHLIVALKTIITLASMTYIVDVDAYELHPGDENPSTILLINARVLHFMCDRDSLLFKIVFAYLCQ